MGSHFLARSALVCLRGSRSRFQGVSDNSLELPARVARREASFVNEVLFIFVHLLIF